ncbi:hypothetical protein ABLE91_14420 [Aquabacter sp. CN5-332]|uniref:hypothetical protein n=1 Tax=Aquabacter sp. CN5-332 TaxID=3156608 RepID=UPI0032B58008
MRDLALGFAFLFAAGAAQAASCDYQLNAAAGGQKMQIHECWDLSKWPADKAQSFCKSLSSPQEGAQARMLASCPAKRSAQCASAKLSAPSADSIPPEYFADMPKEVADQIRASMKEAGAAFAAYDGLETTVNYYPSPAGGPSLDDQRQDCEVGKKGRFLPGGS